MTAKPRKRRNAAETAVYGVSVPRGDGADGEVPWKKRCRGYLWPYGRGGARPVGEGIPPLPLARQRDRLRRSPLRGGRGRRVESGVLMIAFALVAASVRELAVVEVERVAALGNGQLLIDLHAAGMRCSEAGVYGLAA